MKSRSIVKHNPFRKAAIRRGDEMSKGKNQDLPNDGAGVTKGRISTAGKSQPEGTNNESEKLFQAIFEQAAVGVAQIVSKTGRFIRINQRYCDIVGYSRKDMEKKTFQEITHPDDLQTDLDNMARLLTGEIRQFTMEKRYYRKDRSIVWVNLTVSPLWGPGEEPSSHVAVVEDITARKRAEEKLLTLNAALEQRVAERTIDLKKSNEQLQREIAERKQTEQQLALLSFSLNHVRESAFLSDEHARFYYVNEAACRSLGYSQEELLGLSVADVDPDFRLDIWPDHWRELKSCGSLMFESRHKAKDGRIFPVEVSANYFAYNGRSYGLGLARDINDRKISEKKLRESGEKYRRLIENIEERHFIYVHDTKGEFTYISPSIEHMLGYTPQEFCTHYTRYLTDSPLNDDVVRHTNLSIQGVKQSPYHIEIYHKSGAVKWLEVAESPIRNESGHVIAVQGIATDITERHLLEQEQLKSQKLDAVGTLAGGIAHDFNNLLQGVFGYLSLAKLKFDQKEKALAMLDQAEKALSMSVNLTSQLLTFSKGGKPVIKKTDIRPMIENAAKFALSGSRCGYQLSIAGDLWYAEVDEGQIAQVIQNIVLNASEAMPAGGTVKISADNREIPRGDSPSLPDGGRFVRMSVSDTGIGIPERYRERIFDPYFTTKQKGSGLGLATSYSIIRNHGGVIEAASEQNRGSTFVIFLPASETEGNMETQPMASAAGKKGRILIMDDEEMVRNVAGGMVEAIGHEVESAAGGEEAIEMFRRARESGRPFDVIILDLTVKGGMGGEAAIRKIREMDPDVIAVVSSGYADNPVVSEFRAYGFAAALNKPYRADALRDCLNTLIA